MNARRFFGTCAVVILALLPCLGLGFAHQDAAAQPDTPAKPITTFTSVDVYVDSGDAALAAYQVEFIGTIDGDAARVKLVGIEGSGGAKGSAFAEPPAYDPAALVGGAGGNRVILADFSTAGPAALPHGKTRVARLHFQIQTPAGTPHAKPAYTVKLIAAGAPDGTHIHATASVEGDAR